MTDRNAPTSQHGAITVAAIAVIAMLISIAAYRTAPVQDSAAETSLAIAAHLTSPGTAVPDLNPLQRGAGVGYPEFLRLIMGRKLSQAEAADCSKLNKGCPDRNFYPVFIAQTVISIVGLIALFCTGYIVSKSWLVGILTMIFAFLAGSYGVFSGQLSPLAVPHAVMALALLFLSCAVEYRYKSAAFAAGLSLGLLGLFTPLAFVSGALTIIATGLLFAQFRSARGNSWTQPAVILIGFLLPVLWLFCSQNSGALQTVLLTQISQDIADQGNFAALGWHDHLGLLLTGIPIFGAAFETVFALPSIEVVEDAANKVATPTRSFVDHVLATPSLAVRGLWVGSPILTLLGLLQLGTLLRFAKEDARLLPVLITFSPVLFLFAVNVFATANRPELNFGLIVLLVFSTAYLIGRTEIRRNFWRGQQQATA